LKAAAFDYSDSVVASVHELGHVLLLPDDEQRELRFRLYRLTRELRHRLARNDEFIGDDLLGQLVLAGRDLKSVETCLRLDRTPTEAEIDKLFVKD
jgi:hypothetical protein